MMGLVAPVAVRRVSVGSRVIMRALILLLVVIGVAEIFLGHQLSKTTSPQSLVVESSDALRGVGMQRAAPQLRPGRVRFRPFAADPKYHNKTVNGKAIPGPFLNERLFLIGARLTTSYVPNDASVHVDVFGFPGDGLVRKERGIKCKLDTLPKKWKFIKNKHFFENRTALYCQLECDYTDHDPATTGATISESSWSQDCGEPIRMHLVPLISGDINQNGTTFIWRCDVTQHLHKSRLIQHQQRQAAPSSVRVRLDLKVARNKTTTTVSFLQLISGAKPPPITYYTMYEVTKIDIPLHTAVVGHGGPQIRSSQQGYFSSLQQNNKEHSPMDVGLCLAIYGRSATRYLAEFVQHHKNVGISQIVVGMDTTMDSDDLYAAEEILSPFIDEGFVALQATGLNDYFTCASDMAKVHFYHQCLYYYKGLSKYSATWDLDEYWIPPVQLEMTGKNSFKYGMVAFADDEIPLIEKSATRAKDHDHVNSKFIHKSRHSAFSHLVTKDPLWRQSNYSKSISIRDVLRAIEQAHKYRGCEDKWCFFLTPSFYSFMKSIVTRTHRIGHDFDRRNAKSDRIWQKGIARTQVAMMGGIHLPGSCRFPNDPKFYPFSQKLECFPHIWDSGEYGRILHYQSLMEFRDDWGDVQVDEWADDEYVTMYADTVSAQLDRHNYGIESTEP